MRRTILIAPVAILVIAGFVFSQKRRLETVGPTEDGGFLLNTGWRIKPAGKSIPLSTLPMSQALAPDGRTMAVLNAGFAPASVSLVDLETGRETARVTVGDGWRGLAFSPAGDKLYIGGGARASVTEFRVSRANLSIARKIDLAPGDTPASPHLIADVVVGSGTVLVADEEQDRITLIDSAKGKVLRSLAAARNPYALVLSPDGQFVFVSSWSTAQMWNTASLTVWSWRVSQSALTPPKWYGCLLRVAATATVTTNRRLLRRAWPSPVPTRTLSTCSKTSVALGTSRKRSTSPSRPGSPSG